MSRVEFRRAFYVKLGRKGEWEQSCISEGKIRIGWHGQTTEDINSREWDKIRKELDEEIGNRGASTRDFNSLRMIVESGDEDVWITFHASRLWWSQLGTSRVSEDEISKFRKLKRAWSDRDLDGNLLLINRIPGTISKTQGFRGTICRVREVEDLKRLLNNIPSAAYQGIQEAKARLVEQIVEGLKQLHWKDFETLLIWSSELPDGDE